MQPIILFVNPDATVDVYVPDLPNGAKTDHYSFAETERIGATMLRERGSVAMAVVNDPHTYFRFFRWFVRRFGLSRQYQQTDYGGPAVMLEASEQEHAMLEKAGFKVVSETVGAKTYSLDPEHTILS